MATQKLTKKSIAAITAPDPSGKQVVVWDQELKGLGVLVSGTTSTKSYIVQRTIGPRGKLRRVTIGPTNTLTIEQARDQAADVLNLMRRGVDPKAKTDEPTVQEGLDDYLAARKDLRPESVRAYRRIEKTLTSWMGTKLRDLTGDMVEQRHRALAADIGEFTANAAMRTLGIVYNYVADRVPGMPPNPVNRLKRQWFAEPRRTGMIRSEDMPRFYSAVQALSNPVARDYILLLLFTGMRRTEAATLKWSDVDFGERVIRVRATETKAKRRLDLPMSDFVRDLLVARRAQGLTDYVFPSAGESGRIWDPGLGAVKKATGIAVSCHDLRRGYITIASSVVDFVELKAMVNHSLGADVTAGYVQVSQERLREAVQKVADKIKALCEVDEIGGANVARM